MGIRLDWEIESEKEVMQQTGEDPAAVLARRLARLRLLVVLVMVLALIGVVVFAVSRRLEDIDRYYETLLRDTVEAEVTALRIGSEPAFLAVQHQGNTDWLRFQETTFASYAQLKVERDIQLTGRVLAIEVDGQRRGRVMIEEIIDGVPYVHTWSYFWFDDQGWLHVPLDTTFWGAAGSYRGENVTVNYFEVDNPVAVDVGSRLERWLQIGCAAVGCTEVPSITIDIVPDQGVSVSWSPEDIWRLRIPSPYLTRARFDTPFNFDLQSEVADLIAQRLVALVTANLQPQLYSDSDYFYQSAVQWLIGRFLQINTNALLLTSMAQNYGDEKIGELLRLLQPTTSTQALPAMLGVATLDQASLDWRDYLTWRLAVEAIYITQRRETDFIALYDIRDEVVRTSAYARYDANLNTSQQVVVSLLLEPNGERGPRLVATIQEGSGDFVQQKTLIFRLVDNLWLRAN